MTSLTGGSRSPVAVLRAFAWTARMEVSGAVRYRFSLVSDVLVYTVLLGFFMLSGSGHSLAEKYGYADYRTLLFAGYLAWTFANAALVSSVNNTTSELGRGTFFRKLKSRFPLPLLQAGELASSVALTALVAAVVALLGWLAWGLEVRLSPVSVVAVLVCTVGMYGMGLILDGVALLFKRVGSLTFLFQLGLLFVTDTLPTVPDLLGVTSFIPLTACNDVIRLSIVGGDPSDSLLLLVGLSVVWAVVGNAIFRLLLARARRTGNLLFY